MDIRWRIFWSTFLLTSMTVLSLGYLLLERTGDYLLEQLDSELTSEAKGAIFILSNPEYKISSYQKRLIYRAKVRKTYPFHST